MRRRRWRRRSTEAKPDEIQTNSILLHQGCWCTLSPESRKKNLRFTRDSVERALDRAAQTHVVLFVL